MENCTNLVDLVNISMTILVTGYNRDTGNIDYFNYYRSEAHEKLVGEIFLHETCDFDTHIASRNIVDKCRCINT